MQNQEEPSFLTERRWEISDLTLCSGVLACEVHILPKLLLLDHRYNLINHMHQHENVNYRNSWNTFWASYMEELRGKLEGYHGGH